MAGKGIRTHYDNLQVARDASPEVIRAAYRVLSQRFHPDKNIDNAQAAEQVMRALNEAYQILSDPPRRAQHDRWIAGMEARGRSTNMALQCLRGGNASYYQLPAEVQQRLQERSKGRIQNQLKVPIGGVARNYLWLVGLCGWFAMLFVFSRGRPWSPEAVGLLGALTLVVAVFMAINACAVLRWLFSPLKQELILTPVYFIKTWNDNVTYWPIWELKGIHVMHHYENGAYAGSDTTLRFPTETVAVTINGENTAQQFVEQLHDYERQIRIAQRQNNMAFFREEDDFKDVGPPAPRKKSWLTRETLAGYGVSVVTAALIFSIAYHDNLRRPDREPVPVNAESVVLQLLPAISFS